MEISKTVKDYKNRALAVSERFRNKALATTDVEQKHTLWELAFAFRYISYSNDPKFLEESMGAKE